MKPLSLLLTVVAGLACADARAAVFKYVDGATRVASYTNFRPRDYPARELKVAEPAQPKPPKRTDAVAGAGTGAKPGTGGGGAAAAEPAPAKLAMLTPAAFPRVAPAVQRERDIDRKKILGDELEAEQESLRLALGRNAAAEVIGRHRSDVAALEREVARLK